MIENPTLKNNLNVTDPKSYTNNVIGGIFSLFFVVAVLYFLWHFVFATFHMIASSGDPKKFEDSKNELQWALVGIAICFSVFGALKLLGTIFGIKGLELLQIPWPTI